MRIAVDAMGGDFAPGEVVKGAVAAAREYGVEIALVGPTATVERELAKWDTDGTRIEIVEAPEYLVEGEHPAYALRQKRQASVAVATRMVKEGKAAAAVSAGPTGGVVASALQFLGTVEGVARPVVGGNFLGFAPSTLVMDLGGNVDCRPEQFLDFAIVGAVYARKFLGIENPTVALLSIGAEEGKGNELVRESYPLFLRSGLNFIGNVEGYDIPLGKANVIICDGFVGNILVKFSEALGKVVSGRLEEKLKGKIPDAELKKITGELVLATNFADARGGGPLLAVDGISCVAHGRCKAEEISRVIGQAKLAVEKDLVGTLKTELADARKRLAISSA
ncbi:MAG: phosphate acyltransferase PlsX [Dehalococcoidia bacterium]|nr:MAG: phosphate acyltransferase PlsX [Dehalococcoidia bacterium]